MHAGQRVAVEGGGSLASSPDAEVLAGPGGGDAREPTAAERTAADGELTGTIIDLQPSGIAVIWSTCATDAVSGETAGSTALHALSKLQQPCAWGSFLACVGQAFGLSAGHG